MLRLVIRCLKFLFGFALLIPAFGQEDPIANAELSALTTSLDPDTNAVTFTGDARLINGNAVLEADEIRYFTGSNLAIATGNVRLTDGADRILAEKITFNRGDLSFTGKTCVQGVIHFICPAIALLEQSVRLRSPMRNSVASSLHFSTPPSAPSHSPT